MSLEFDLDVAYVRIQELEEDLPLAAEAFRKLRDIRALCDLRSKTDPKGRDFRFMAAWISTDELYPILDSGEYLT